MRTSAVLTAGCWLVLLLGGCGTDEHTQDRRASAAEGGNDLPGPYPLPQGSRPVKLDPTDFSDRIDNPYWPMAPGTKWVYRGTDGKGGSQRVEVTVTGATKEVAGIPARVVHDVVTEDGKLKEDTYDWYAQDRGGNVWYLGEDTREYENGRFTSSKGSWQAGVDGAQAGLVMPAEPKVGMTFRQEYYEGQAEDAARVLSLDEQAGVAYGSFDGVLQTKDYTPLEPDMLEHKFYAKGVGPVLAVTLSGGTDREELVSFADGAK